MALTTIFFLILSVVAIGTAIGTVASRHPVVSAMNLVLHFLMLAGLYLTLNAEFIAVLQILVYAGAIMVLVVFVILLLNLGKEDSLETGFTARKGVAMTFGAAFVIQILILFTSAGSFTHEITEKSVNVGQVKNLGYILFTKYLFPFEYIALLLLVAVVGALLLGKKKLFLERDLPEKSLK